MGVIIVLRRILMGANSIDDIEIVRVPQHDDPAPQLASESDESRVRSPLDGFQRVIVGTLIVSGITLGATAPVYAIEYTNSSITRTVLSAIAQQDSIRASTGSYAVSKRDARSLDASRYWPASLDVLAGCDDGYVMKVSVPAGATRYISSVTQTPVDSLDDLMLPGCVSPKMVGLPTTRIGSVPGLSIVRSETLGGDLHEAAYVSWESSTERCDADQTPSYRVRSSNTDGWSQPNMTWDTPDNSIEVEGIRNGATYRFEVSARCGINQPWSTPSTVEFEQSIPAPQMLEVAWSGVDTGQLSFKHDLVSSSPVVGYVLEYGRGGVWTPIISGIRESNFAFFPPAYRYQEGDTFRLLAVSDRGVRTEYTTPVNPTVS